MKKMIVASTLLLLSSAAWATLATYEGRGTAQQYCTSSEASFCIDDVKRQSEEQARQQGEQQCQINRGTVASDGYCNDQCYPNYIPIGTANTWVSCTSLCNIECDVPATSSTNENISQ